MGEFENIARFFAPLAATPEARGLLDDTALVPGGPWIVTTDTIVEGVHFLPDDPIDRIARKALRVNLSDAAAKGAAPRFYLLALMWPNGRPAVEMESFAAGLAVDQRLFGCTLVGGDTTCTPGPLAISITLLASPIGAFSPSRGGAAPGDELWVTGAIGDGVLGLAVRNGTYRPEEADGLYLTDRYQLPEPRTGLAALISDAASASMDVSDGLLGDAAKLANASGVSLRIDPEAVPLSQAAAHWLAAQADRQVGLSALLSGGDDYEILFSAPPGKRGEIFARAAQAGVQTARIGQVLEGRGVEAAGLKVAAYEHRWGA